MIKNPKLRQPIGKKKPSTLPSMYECPADSAFPLFPHGKNNPKYDKAISEDEMSETKKAIALLDQMNEMYKADMSAGRTTMPSESQAKRSDERSYEKYSIGVSGDPTPDLPERGRDWHGTVPGVPDEDQATSDEYDKQPQNILAPPKPKQINEQAIKALSGAPIFTSGPVLPPRELDFLARHGFSPDEIDSGLVQLTPTMRAEFNRELQSAVQKSITAFADKLEK